MTADIAVGHLRIEPLTEADKSEAARLIEQYGATQDLRTLDALQLAVMKRLGADYLRTVYCADRALVAILAVEGFSVVNPDPVVPENSYHVKRTSTRISVSPGPASINRP